MFAVKRYSNPQGENIFVPTFDGQPSKEIPSGFTEVAGPEETSNKVLQRAGLGAPTSREAILKRAGIDPSQGAASVLTRAGIKPEKPSQEFKQQQDLLSQQQQIATSDQTKTLLDKQQEELKNYLQSTEAPTTVSSKSIDHLTTQLKSQYQAIQSSSGYKYQNENELDSIFSGMAAKLAVNGINDLRDIGVEEGEAYTVTESQPDPNNPEDTIQVQKQVTPKHLINKVTGKRLQDVAFTSPQFRNDLASSGKFSADLAKLRGDLTLEDRAGFTRWGKDLSVDGQADYAIEFVDGNPVMMPVWKDTKSDLTPLMMLASAALMAYGVPAQIGGALTPTGTAVGTQMAVGNAVVAGGMTALSGGDLEDIAKAAVLSGGMTYATAYVPSISKSVGEAILGQGAPGALTVGTAITNAGLNGIAAVLMGQDPQKAMLAGAVQGAVQVNASDFLKSTFGNETFKNLSKTLNIKPEDMEKVVIRSISKGAGALAYNRNFFTTFRDNLVSEGFSLSAANTATNAMAKNPNMTEDQLKRINRTIQNVSKVAIVAKQRGLNPANVLESVYPRIILDMAKPIK